MHPHELFAVNTYSYTQSHAVADCLDRLAARGYRRFELMMYPGHLWPPDTDAGARRALARRLAAGGLAAVSLNMPNVDLNIAAAAPEMRAHTLRLLEGVIALAGDLGVPGVVIGPGKANPLFPAPVPELTRHFHAALDRLLPRAAAAGTRLLVENMPFAFLPRIEALLAAIDAHGGGAEVGIVYDVANGHFVGEDVAAGIAAVGRRLALVHLSDTGRSVYRHDAVGLGDLPFAAIPPALAAAGYDGPQVLEIIAARDPDGAIDGSAADLAALGWAAQRR
ncbi:MAG: TIM barrel protein [Dongiaceae bacterium]